MYSLPKIYPSWSQVKGVEAPLTPFFVKLSIELSSTTASPRADFLVDSNHLDISFLRPRSPCSHDGCISLITAVQRIN